MRSRTFEEGQEATRLLNIIADQLDHHKPCDHTGAWEAVGVVSFGVQIKAEDVKAIFAVLDREPARTKKPLGSCETCRFAENGRERGWRAPCVSCSRPEMSEFKPVRGKQVARAR